MRRSKKVWVVVADESDILNIQRSRWEARFYANFYRDNGVRECRVASATLTWDAPKKGKRR